MLQHVVQTFEFARSITEAARVAVTSYEGLLVSNGYIARKSRVVHEDASRRVITVSGIACAPDCLSRAYGNPRIAGAVDDIRSAHGATDTIRAELALATVGERYASEPPWTCLRLTCDCILGLSPLRTPDGGFVARFVPHLSDDLAAALWAWDVEYDCIYNCWLASAGYERWAERALVDPRSVLNRTGTSLAARLSREIGCPVDYVGHRGDP